MSSSKSSGNIFRNQCKSQVIGLSHDEKLGIMEALDHFFVAREYKEIGSCTVCKKICEKNCADYGAHYCSVECQNVDWPKQKATCTKLRFRGSESDFNKVSSSALINTTSSSCGIDNMCQNDTSIVNNYKSPSKCLLNQMSKKSGSPVHEIHLPPSSYRLPNKTKSEFDNKTKILNKSSKKFSINKEMNKNSIETQMKIDPNSRKLFTNEQKGRDEDKNWISLLWSDKTIGGPISPTTAKFAARKIREVTCIIRETEDRYWVMDARNASKYAEIQTTLAKECDGYDSIDPQQGLVCGCSFADEWYRGKVVSVFPKISVHFIDYGNTSDYAFDFVKKLPESLKSFPGLAFLIQFEQGSPNQYKFANLDSLNLTVEETGKTSDGVSCVKVIIGCFGPTAEGSPKQKIRNGSVRGRSVFEALAKDSKGMIFFTPGGSKTRFGSILPEGDENAEWCLENILKFDSTKSSPIEGKKGDYVLVVDKEGNNQRGKIISKVDSTYYVFSTDCGNVLSTDVVFPMPAEAKDLIELGAKVTAQEIFSMESELEDLDAVYFHITGEQTSGKWPCALKGTSDKKLVAKGFIEKPTATLEANPNYLNLESGCTVEIPALSSENSFHVRAVGAGFEDEVLKLNNESRDHAAKGESLTCSPEPGHQCCVRFFEDGCLYRTEDIITYEDMKRTTLTLDSHCDLFLLHINEHEFSTKRSFWATDDGSKNMVHVLKDLTVQISAHCAASQTPYHPAVSEICLAEFEGDWYRALTVGSSADVFTVFFLDFGNTCAVKSKSIRKMEREFIKAPALAVNCILKEHQRSVANPETTRKLLKALEERVNSALNNVHVTDRDGDAFFVTIPEIQEILSAS